MHGKAAAILRTLFADREIVQIPDSGHWCKRAAAYTVQLKSFRLSSGREHFLILNYFICLQSWENQIMQLHKTQQQKHET